MKEFIRYMGDFLRDKNDGSSYKRLTGFSCFIVAIIITFSSERFDLIVLFLSVALGESIATLFEKKE